MNSGIDFIRKFKKFVFGIVAKISEKFLEVLFETLKKNLLQIIKLILQDIYKTTKDRRFLIIRLWTGYCNTYPSQIYIE